MEEQVSNLLNQATGFDWDEGNLLKNWKKHQVSAAECEEAFFNRPLIAASDLTHSEDEVRFYALARTSSNRELFLVFTFRKNKIRVISARDMNQQEREVYWRSV